MIETVHRELFDAAKTTAGRLCFDISVSKEKCIQSMQLLIAELQKMLDAHKSKEQENENV